MKRDLNECNPKVCKIKTHGCLVFINEQDQVGPGLYHAAYGDRPSCGSPCPLNRFFCTRTQGHEGAHETHGYDDFITAYARWPE